MYLFSYSLTLMLHLFIHLISIPNRWNGAFSIKGMHFPGEISTFFLDTYLIARDLDFFIIIFYSFYMVNSIALL